MLYKLTEPSGFLHLWASLDSPDSFPLLLFKICFIPSSCLYFFPHVFSACNKSWSSPFHPNVRLGLSLILQQIESFPSFGFVFHLGISSGITNPSPILFTSTQQLLLNASYPSSVNEILNGSMCPL